MASIGDARPGGTVVLLIVKRMGDGGESQDKAAQRRVGWSVFLRCKVQVCVAVIALCVVTMTVVCLRLRYIFWRVHITRQSVGEPRFKTSTFFSFSAVLACSAKVIVLLMIRIVRTEKQKGRL